MGRYYWTENFEGKFTFAVQGSYEPAAVYDMTWLDDDEAEAEGLGIFSCTDAHLPVIRKEMDACFNRIGIAPEDRKYWFEKNEDIYEYVYDVVTPKVFKEYDQETDEGIPYGGFDKEFLEKHGFKKDTLYPIGDRKAAEGTLVLGMVIHSELVMSGSCMLYAEM